MMRSKFGVGVVCAVSVSALAALPPPPAPPTPAPTPASPLPPPASPTYSPPSLGAWPAERVGPLIDAVDPAKLRAWHDLLGREPHIAGTPGDARQIERLAAAFRDMGLEVEVHEFWPLLARPVAAVLEVIDLDESGMETARVPLVTKEKILPEDADTAHPDLTWGWNAYSGSGDVTAEVVYVNRGTREDFAALKALGVDLRGKVALCRYGGNFRGYKAKFAEAAGAAALVIFVDGPGGAGGAGAGEVYPAGGAPSDTCIERGSVKTLDYPGDPLTPGTEATEHAMRLEADKVGLPRIPVQPIGYGAAREIIARMAGDAGAEAGGAGGPKLPEGWQGGMPIRYAVVGGPRVKVRVKVEQVREVRKTANVIGTLKADAGPEGRPDEWVLVGSHHDAWGFGACDPLAGTICTMEAARVFAEAAARGPRPKRTMKFCCWGAEEFSIIGSTEWVESRRDELAAKAVAYINLDMSAMGPDFGSSSAPALKTLIAEVARHVPAVGGEAGAGQSVSEAWTARADGADPALAGQPLFGDLGGGSDHVAFWCHAGIPSCGMGSRGAKGTAYHSVYDTLSWYRRNVGDDYQPARMVTQMVVGTLARLAGDEAPPLDHARDMHDVARRLDALATVADDRLPDLAGPIRELAGAARAAAIGPSVWSVPPTAKAFGGGGAGGGKVEGAEAARRVAPARWRTLRARTLTESGLPQRAWYRNELAGPDADSGYAAWVLPRLARALDAKDAVAARVALERYGDMIGRRRDPNPSHPNAARPGDAK